MENNNVQYQPPPQMPPQPPPNIYPNMPPVIDEKKLFGRQVSFISGGLIIYTTISLAVTVAYMIVWIIFETIKSHNKLDIDALLEKIQTTDGGMSIAVTCGCLFMLLFFLRRIKPKELFRKREQKMTAPKFLMILCVLMSIQLPMSLLSSLFEMVLNLAGYSAQQAIEASQAGSKTISMMLYAGFIGPFAEEFIYRGYTMQAFERTGAGKGYALCMSALLFGIMHANPTQSVYAIFAGLVFAYAAMEYGILWSLILHIMNNFVFGDLFIFLTRNLPEATSDIISWLLLGLLFLGGILIIFLKRKEAVAYIRATFNTESKYYKWTFSNVLLWLFIIANVAMAIFMIQKVKTI